MKKGYNIYKTVNWGNVWMIDGERGRATYPGDLPLSAVREYYEAGIDWKEATNKMTRKILFLASNLK